LFARRDANDGGGAERLANKSRAVFVSPSSSSVSALPKATPPNRPYLFPDWNSARWASSDDGVCATPGTFRASRDFETESCASLVKLRFSQSSGEAGGFAVPEGVVVLGL
jgi:hypothetical protein